MGQACGVYGGRREIVTVLWCGNVRERDRLEDLSVDGRVVLKYIVIETQLGSVDWVV
jgi:hypothetical protein